MPFNDNCIPVSLLIEATQLTLLITTLRGMLHDAASFHHLPLPQPSAPTVSIRM